ncbi:hypothetical protein Tco_0930958 [Tanacetum coccineum]
MLKYSERYSRFATEFQDKSLKTFHWNRIFFLSSEILGTLETSPISLMLVLTTYTNHGEHLLPSSTSAEVAKKLEWTRFVCPVENKDTKKTNKMSYPKFIKIIINYFMSKDQHEDTQVYGTILPMELTNQAMLESKAYKTYYAFAYGEKAPKPKLKTQAKVAKSDKKKQPAMIPKAKGLNVLSKVPDEEQQKTSGTDEGTGTKPKGPDVPTYDSESKKESWGDSDEEDDDDEDDFKDDDGDNDDADDNDDDDGDYDDGDDNDGNDNDEADSERTEKPLLLVPDHRGRQVIPQDYFINNDLEYLKGGDLSRRYSTSVTKTKVATYEIKWFKDLVRNLWVSEKVTYDKHAYLGISHWRPKRQRFYGYARNLTSSKDVYSRRRIIAVTRLTIEKKYDYGHLEEIEVCRHDRHLKRLMRADELHKFSDGALNDVQTSLHDISKGVRMEYLPKRKLSGLDKKRARVMVQDIDKQLFKR